MRAFFLIIPILTSLYGAVTPTAGETETVETLMNFRVTRGNTWKDPQTDQPLYRLNHRNELVQAACDSDITFTTSTTAFNAGTIMGGYLIDSGSLPQTSMRSAALTALVSDQNWNSLLTIMKKHRISQNRILRDCFGRDLFEVGLGVRNPAADIRDIVDIPTLIAAIEPVIRGASAPAAATAAPNFTGAESANYEAFLTFRASRNVMCTAPRTGEQLYRFVDGAIVPAAKDDDVLPDLSNVVTLMTTATTTPPAATAVGTVAPSLSAVFADVNLNRLYQLVEDSRRTLGNWLTDAIGRPLYTASAGTRAQVVNMKDISDTASLVKAIFGFFPVNLRPVVQVCSCGSHTVP